MVPPAKRGGPMPKRPRPVNALRTAPAPHSVARIPPIRRSLMRTAAAIAAIALLASPLGAQSVDRTEVGRVLDEGLNRSEVMRIVQHLTDHIGPRLTNSPGMRAAEDWTASK